MRERDECRRYYSEKHHLRRRNHLHQTKPLQAIDVRQNHEHNTEDHVGHGLEVAGVFSLVVQVSDRGPLAWWNPFHPFDPVKTIIDFLKEHESGGETCKPNSYSEYGPHRKKSDANENDQNAEDQNSIEILEQSEFPVVSRSN